MNDERVGVECAPDSAFRKTPGTSRRDFFPDCGIDPSGIGSKSAILMQRIVNRGDKEGGDGPESSLRPASFASYLG